MGFYPTEQRPGNSLENSSKPHTPYRGFRVSGLRYYNPELGRWVNRDPLGERGGENIHMFVENRAIGEVDLLGALLWKKLDPPADANKCQKIRDAFNITAHGFNREIWNRWLSGSGLPMVVDMDKLDAGGFYRTKALLDAVNKGMGLADGLGCGGSGETTHNLPLPDKTNAHAVMPSSWMVSGFRFWYECDVSYQKECPKLLPCCLKKSSANCAFHAVDNPDFHRNHGTRFTLLGKGAALDISDDLVRDCFPAGRTFKLTAEDTKKLTLTLPCGK